MRVINTHEMKSHILAVYFLYIFNDAVNHAGSPTSSLRSVPKSHSGNSKTRTSESPVLGRVASGTLRGEDDSPLRTSMKSAMQAWLPKPR